MVSHCSVVDDPAAYPQVLINNAAVGSETLTRTKEGFETQIGVNHFGHFLFTSLLFPAILEAKSDTWKPRIINLSSAAALFGSETRFDDIHYTARPDDYNKYTVYGQTKTANALFSVGLADRYGDAGILSYSVHPGVVRGTTMGSTVSDADLISWGECSKYRGMDFPSQNVHHWIGMLEPDGTPNMHFKTIPEGASTYVLFV